MLSKDESAEANYWQAKAQKLHQENASLYVALEMAETLASRRMEIIEQKDRTIVELTGEIRRLGVEINGARSAAANSVQEYIAASGG
jgi:DNA repair exonuclease SbcCD ATPase subunit